MSRRLTLAKEFPTLTVPEILQADYPKNVRDIELALWWLGREAQGELQHCPPRAGIAVRRDIRQARIRLRIARNRAGITAVGRSRSTGVSDATQILSPRASKETTT